MHHARVRASLAVVLMWGAAAIATPLLMWQLYDRAMARDHQYLCCKFADVWGGGGWDFSMFLQSARLVAAGHSPYGYAGYVYTPVLAVLTVPFTHMSYLGAWHLWTLLEIATVVIGIAVFVASERRGRPAWQAPALFAFAALTAAYFFPASRVITLGQVDLLTMLLLLGSAWAQSRGSVATRSVLLGCATLLKVWPIFIGLALLQPGLAQRKRALIAFALTVASAPVLVVIFGGLSGPRMFYANFTNQVSDRWVSHSSWGTASMLFSRTGLTSPLIVSNSLRIVTGALLCGLVIALMLVAIRTPGDPALCVWNLAGCLVIMFPKSHLAYSVLMLPVLWIWGARVLDRGQRSRTTWIVFAVAVAWWIVQTQSWPDDAFPPTDSVWLYCLVFAANLVLCTASVVGNWIIQGRSSSPAPQAPSAVARATAFAATRSVRVFVKKAFGPSGAGTPSP